MQLIAGQLLHEIGNDDSKMICNVSTVSTMWICNWLSFSKKHDSDTIFLPAFRLKFIENFYFYENHNVRESLDL